MRRTGLIMAGCLMSLAFATTAHAGGGSGLGSMELFSTEASTETCRSPHIVNPFSRFQDRRDYVMAPDGSFESEQLSGWQLAGGAQRVAEADPVDLGDADGSGLLALSAKATAVSPTMCVDLHYPTFRVLAKAARKPNFSELEIEIIYPDANKPAWKELSKFDGKHFIDAGEGWRLTSDLDMDPDRGGKAAGIRRVAFRFTALSGDWRIDDLYVDPTRRN